MTTDNKSIATSGPWNMSDEITFINGLGYWRLSGRHGRETPVPVSHHLSLLRGYLKGLSLRTSWVGLDRAALERHVTQRIADYEKRDPTSPF